MKVETLNIEQFKDLIHNRLEMIYNDYLVEKIHYFHYTDFDTFLAPDSYKEHLRFTVAYTDKDILGICKFAFYDISKNFSISYISTNKDFQNQGVAKAIIKGFFKYFSEKYPNTTLALSGYSISGWKCLRKHILLYSQKYNVQIKEQPIEYITEWTDENTALYEESRKIVKPLY